MGDGEKLLTYLNSALKALLGFDIFPRRPKKCEILLPSEICKNTHFSHFTWLSKKTVGDGETLLTYLNSALKALLGFDILTRGTKKSEILLPSVIRGRKTQCGGWATGKRIKELSFSSQGATSLSLLQSIHTGCASNLSSYPVQKKGSFCCGYSG